MKIDYLKYTILFFRCCLCMLLIRIGSEIIGENGERIYNKYFHASRKMLLPDTKPGDASFFGGAVTWNEFNLSLINLHGSFYIASGAMILSGRKTLGSIFLIFACIIMMASKDNPWLQSDVAAINREKD